VNPPILRLPHFEKQFILRTDACNSGIGAILLQEESGVKHPIAFASRKLLTRESHYSTIEKERLSIVWAVRSFKTSFMRNRLFWRLIISRCCSWENPNMVKMGRLVRWTLVLQQYQFTVKAIKGLKNVGVDFLSRHSVTPEVECGV